MPPHPKNVNNKHPSVLQTLNEIIFSVSKINLQLIIATIITFVFLIVIAIRIYYCIFTDLYNLHI